MSVIKIRERLGARMRGEESGFTLVELLVVMLILGLLAAIAIPAFFNQRDKAHDADAKANAKTAQTAIETWATDHNGSYLNVTDAELEGIEPTLTGANVTVEDTTATADSYEIVSTSESSNVFKIERASTGAVTYPCDTAGEGGCPSGGGGWGN